jgi:hypothetical protein
VFPISQSCPLSQEAEKSSGTCSVCLAARQLHLKDGKVHRHGPRDNPCSGSNKAPLQVISVLSPRQSNNSAASVQAPDESDRHTALLDPVSRSSAFAPLAAFAQSSITDLCGPVEMGVITHIPKSARPACSAHLASLLRAEASHPESTSNWLALSG